MANRSFKVKIGSVWLTSDGLESGRACAVEVLGADAILRPRVGNTTVANGGQPSNESPLTPTGAGRPLEFQIPKMKTAVYDALESVLDAAATGGTEINVAATGEPGSFDADCIVFYNPIYLSFGMFSDSGIKKVVIRLITTQIN